MDVGVTSQSPNVNNIEKLHLYDIPLHVLQNSCRLDHPLSQIPLQNYSLKKNGTDKNLRKGSAKFFYPNAALPEETLTEFLHGSFGEQKNGKRPYASAGALYPASVVLVAFEDGMKTINRTGVFHYKAKTHCLENITDFSEGAEKIKEALLGRKTHQYSDASFALIYLINLDVALYKYRYRGYRHAILEVGAMTSVAERNASTLGLSSLIWSNFSDYELSSALGINPTVTPIIMSQLFGIDKRNDEKEQS